MSSRKAWKWSEWSLFLAPVLMLALGYMARPLHQSMFPAPTPLPVPTPVPTPFPTLWNSVGTHLAILPSRDGKAVYTTGKNGGRPGQISAWDAKSGRLQHSFSDAVGSSAWGVALSDDGKRLAYANDGQLRSERTGIYDAQRGVRLRFLSDHSNTASPRFLPRSHTLFLGKDGRFEVWDADKGILLKQREWLEEDAHNYLMSPSCSFDGSTLAVIRTEEQSDIAYANGRSDEIGLFSMRNWKRNRVFSWPHTRIQWLGFVNDGLTMVVKSTTYDWAKSRTGHNAVYAISRVLLLDGKSGKVRVLRQLVGPQYNTMAISPDGRFFTVVDSFSVLRGQGKNQFTDEWASIEIRAGRTAQKIASLRLYGWDDVGALAFAGDNSALYYGNSLLDCWARQDWRLGVIVPRAP